ncbi:MAG: hypothetical protein AAFO07_26340 [Bacteroidota bacterium]
MDAPLSFDKLENFNDDLPSLGSLSEVKGKLINVLPELSWDSPYTATYVSNGFSIDFSIDQEAYVSSIILAITGNELPVQLIKSICSPYGWYALEIDSNRYLNL